MATGNSTAMGDSTTTGTANLMLNKLCSDLDDNSSKGGGKERNKDLQKTKLCVYNLQGRCGLGSNCQFAHCTSEIRKGPDLTKTQLCTNFMNGKCRNPNCNYAHGEAELVKPPSFKKKMCLWFKQGKCRNGDRCGFVHDLSEADGEILLPSEEIQKKSFHPWKLVAPPGLEVDCDASTAVPSSQSLVESDVTTMSSTPIPEEHLFRMMAGRGSAPLQDQVKSMGLAINDLQMKLAQVQGRRQAASDPNEGMTLQNQINQMQSAIGQLSTQCKGMETHLRTNQQPPPPVVTQPPLNKPRLNASAPRLKTPGANDRSDDRGSTGLPPPAKQVQKAQSSFMKKVGTTDVRPPTTVVKGSSQLQFGMRAGLCVLVVALMVAVEFMMK